MTHHDDELDSEPLVPLAATPILGRAPSTEALRRADRLRELGRNGPTIADLYLRAAGTVQDCTNEAAMAIVSHCVREILNRLPDALGFTFENHREKQKAALTDLSVVWVEVPDDGDEEDSNTVEVSREAALRTNDLVRHHRLGEGENNKRSQALIAASIGPSDGVVQSHPAVLTVTRVRNFFGDHVHIDSGPRKVPPIDETLSNFSLVERILDGCLRDFWRGHEEVRDVLTRANAEEFQAPSEREPNTVSLLIAHPQNAFVFYSELRNPLWFEPLLRLGQIRQPPAPRRVSDDDSMVGPWPEGRYVARMAAVESLSRRVTNFMLNLDTNGNGDAERALIECAIALPPELAKSLVRKIVSVLRKSGGWFDPHRLMDLLDHVATPDSAPAFRRLAGALFDSPGALDDYWCESELPRARALLVRTLGVKAVGLLAGWYRARSQAEDYGRLRGWRATVEGPSDSTLYPVGHALVDATRDAALELARENPSYLPEIVDSLLADSVKSDASERIAMMVVADAVVQGVGEAREIGEGLILLPEFLSWSHEPEWSSLGRAVLADAPDAFIARWLALVESDPEFDAEKARMFVAWRDSKDPEEVTEDDVAALRRERLRNHLALVEPALTPELVERLAELDSEFGTRPSEPSWGPKVTSFVGPTSPSSAEELELMSPEELVTFLETWEPTPNEWFGPTREGLGRELSRLAQTNPGRFIAISDRLVDLGPTYVRNVLQGWEEAVSKEGHSLEWDAALRVITFVSGQPDEGDVSYLGDEDSGWRGAHRAAASLLRAGLGRPEGQRPDLALRASVWAAIQRLAQSPDPSREVETRSQMDPVTAALNFVRPVAMAAAIAYLSWLIQSGATTPGDAAVEEAREVWELLDAHLDVELDSSPAVRAVIGQDLPFLAYASPSWAAAKASRIAGIGASTTETELGAVGWASFVTLHDPSERMLEILSDIYRARMAGTWVPMNFMGSTTTPEVQTGEHVLTLWLRGFIGPDTPDDLVRTLFADSDVEVRAGALAHLGWRVFRSTGELDEGFRQRACEMWDWRFDATGPGPDVAELAGFGWWFRSGKLPRQWAVTMLARAARLGVEFRAPGQLIEDLKDYAREFPAECVTILEAFLDAGEPWEADTIGRNAAPIIAAGLDSGLADTATVADRLLQTLGARGHLGLKSQVQSLRAPRDLE